MRDRREAYKPDTINNGLDIQPDTSIWIEKNTSASWNSTCPPIALNRKSVQQKLAVVRRCCTDGQDRMQHVLLSG